MTTRIDLEGGTTLFVEESFAVPLVSFSIALRTGAAQDPVGKEGLARIAMRMLRRGTEGMTSVVIEDTIDRLGAEMAVDTGASSVAMHAQVIARSLDPFVDLVTKLIAKPTFPGDEFERLRRETLSEILEARDNDKALCQVAFRKALFPGHAYGRGGTGTKESVAALTLADVRSFYEEHVVQGNIVIGMSGAVTTTMARSLAERLVAGRPRLPAVKDLVPEPTPPSGRRLFFVDKPERTQTQVLIGSLGSAPSDPDHTAFGVANAIFGGTFTSRLMKEVRSKRGWSYGAYARSSIDRRRQAFSVWTFPAATDAAACIALEIELLEKYVADGVTPRETSFIKKYLTRSHAFDIDTAAKRLHQSLDSDLLGLPAGYHEHYLDHVKAVTPESASAAVKARLDPKNLIFVVVGTASEILPAIEKSITSLESTVTKKFDAD